MIRFPSLFGARPHAAPKPTPADRATVSPGHKARSTVDGMSFDDFAFIARRVPPSWVLRFLNGGFVDMLGVQDLQRCRELSRQFDRHADAIERHIAAHDHTGGGTMTAPDLARVDARRLS